MRISDLETIAKRLSKSNNPNTFTFQEDQSPPSISNTFHSRK